MKYGLDPDRAPPPRRLDQGEFKLAFQRVEALVRRQHPFSWQRYRLGRSKRLTENVVLQVAKTRLSRPEQPSRLTGLAMP